MIVRGVEGALMPLVDVAKIKDGGRIKTESLTKNAAYDRIDSTLISDA